MKKYVKKVSVIILALLVSLAMVMPVSAASVSLNRRSASVTVGKTVKLKVKGTRKKAKWSSSNSKIATVNKNGVVKGKKAGQVKITAKVGKKKLTCKVNVKKAKSKAKTNTNTNTAQNTNVRKVVSKGTTYDHGITYEAYLYNDRTIEVEVINGSNSGIAFGWSFNEFNMAVKTTSGTYNVPVNILKSIENGGVNYQSVQPGAKSGWIITLGNKIPGNVQSVIFSGIYPLNANGLPTFDWSSRTYINYSVSMNLR